MPPRCGSTQRARRRSPGANWTKGEVVFSCSFCTHTRANTVRGGFARSPHRFLPSAAAGGVEARQNPLDTSAARSLGANGPFTRTHTLPHPFMPSAAAGGVSRHAKNPRYGHCAITQGERFINANSHPPQPFMPSAAAGGVSRHAKNPRYDHCAITRGEWFINANSHVPPSVHAECRRRRCRGTLKTLDRSEEHTSELQSLIRFSYAVL